MNAADPVHQEVPNRELELATTAAHAREAVVRSLPEDPGLDFASLNLLCNLESLMAAFREKSLRNRIECASTTVDAMLRKLLDFALKYFDEHQIATLQEQFRTTLERHAEHGRALTMRHWSSSLRSVVLPNFVDPTTITTYVPLGRSMFYTCGTAFTEMLNVIPEDSPVRSEIRQSSIAFLDELKSIWL